MSVKTETVSIDEGSRNKDRNQALEFLLFCNSRNLESPHNSISYLQALLKRYQKLPYQPFPPRPLTENKLLINPNHLTTQVLDIKSPDDWRLHLMQFSPNSHPETPFSLRTIAHIELKNDKFTQIFTLMQNERLLQADFSRNELTYAEIGYSRAGQQGDMFSQHNGTIAVRNGNNYLKPSYHFNIYGTIRQRLDDSEIVYPEGYLTYNDRLDLSLIEQIHTPAGLVRQNRFREGDDVYQRLFNWRSYNQGGYTMTQDKDSSWQLYLNFPLITDLEKAARRFELDTWIDYGQASASHVTFPTLPDLDNLMSQMSGLINSDFSMHIIPHSIPYRDDYPEDTPMI